MTEAQRHQILLELLAQTGFITVEKAIERLGIFLSCLYGSELTGRPTPDNPEFLSCLYGSELRR